MKKSHIVMLPIFLLLIPATIYFGLRFSGRAYYVTSTLVMIETLVPFLLAFENRKPQARELVVIAVLSALAVAARVVIPIPNFKAIFAIIMLSGIAFGPETGFLVGAISAFASNFFKKYMDQSSTTEGSGFIRESNYKYSRQRFGISVSYRIGELKASVKKAARTISNDDVKSSGGEGGGGGE